MNESPRERLESHERLWRRAGPGHRPGHRRDETFCARRQPTEILAAHFSPSAREATSTTERISRELRSAARLTGRFVVDVGTLAVTVEDHYQLSGTIDRRDRMWRHR